MRTGVMKECSAAGVCNTDDIGKRGLYTLHSWKLTGVYSGTFNLALQKLSVSVCARQTDGFYRHCRVEPANVDTEIMPATTSLLIGLDDLCQMLLFGPAIDDFNSINSPGTGRNNAPPVLCVCAASSHSAASKFGLQVCWWRRVRAVHG